MARGYTTRKLEVYSVHGRSGETAIDYGQFFADLVARPAEDRMILTEDRLIAIPTLDIEADVVRLVAYEGDRNENPLIFNAGNAEERIQRLRQGEIVATKTHGLIDLVMREAVIEYNHRGAKAQDLALVLERAGRPVAGPQFSFDLNPVADEGFLEAIDRFEQIRLARVRIARPNQDWNDHYDRLSQLGSQSEGQTVEVEVTAQRRGSLNRDEGVIQLIKQLARRRRPAVKNARITGTRPGEDSPTSVSLAHHVEHQRVTVRLDENGHVEDSSVEELIRDYLSTRREQQGADSCSDHCFAISGMR